MATRNLWTWKKKFNKAKKKICPLTKVANCMSTGRTIPQKSVCDYSDYIPAILLWKEDSVSGMCEQKFSPWRSAAALLGTGGLRRARMGPFGQCTGWLDTAQRRTRRTSHPTRTSHPAGKLGTAAQSITRGADGVQVRTAGGTWGLPMGEVRNDLLVSVAGRTTPTGLTCSR